MAQIRETLTLEDRFSATFTKYLSYGEKAAGATTMAQKASQNYQSVLNSLDRRLISANAQFESLLQEQNRLAAAGQQNTAAFSDLDNQMEKLGNTIRNLTAQYNAVERQANEAADAAKKFSKSSPKSIDGLTGSLKRLAGGYLSLQGLKSVLNLSDTLSQTKARLELMNDGLQTTAELNDMIFASAQRSRGSYQNTADMVAKLGTLAGDAFSGSQEIVAFAEQINKQMTLSGASASGAQAAMLQLTQAMSSGVLRGEELNSILEQTPTIAQAIAQYMNVSTGEMREMASEGKITAEVVKNAMFAAADETNEKFESMPMTWSQVWTQAQNILIKALQPMLTAISWVANHLEQLTPILIGVAGGAIIYAAALGIQTAATWVANGAAKAFFTTLLKNPLTWIVLIIGLVIAAIAKWVQSVGGLKIAWLIVVDNILYAWDTLKAGFMTGVFAVQNWLDQLGLAWKKVGVHIQNWMGDMKVGVLSILQNMVNGAIDIINWFIEKLNMIPGVSIEAIEKVTFATTAAAENEAEKRMRKQQIAAAEYEVFKKRMERQQELAGMWIERDVNHALRQAEIQQKQTEAAAENAFGPQNVDSIPQLNHIEDSVKSIEKSVSMSEEDIKSLVDVAERRYVNNVNLTSQTPVITVNGANTGHTAADRQSLADTIRDILIEQVASGSTRTTARAF